MRRSPIMKVLVVLAACLMIAAACSSDSSDDASAEEDTDTASEPAAETTEEATEAATETATEAPTEEAPALEGDLVGTFNVAPVVCDGDEVTGSYFRMIQPGGDLSAGPFVPNGDSSCVDTSYTGLVPGADGGLVTGVYQSAPDPAFDEAGNGLSDAITEPTLFFGVGFAISTEEDGAVPTVVGTDGELTGDLSAWTAFYGDLVFQQGSPHADGSTPGLTTEVAGSIDPDTGEYVLEWSSQIVGGAFNDFTGFWHIEGTFEAS